MLFESLVLKLLPSARFVDEGNLVNENLCMCVACFIGTASLFDGPFSKLILIF